MTDTDQTSGDMQSQTANETPIPWLRQAVLQSAVGTRVAFANALQLLGEPARGCEPRPTHGTLAPAGTGVAGSPGLAGRMCYQHSMRCFVSALLFTLGLVSACSAPAQSGPPLTGSTSPVTNPTPGTSPAPAATDLTAFGAECSEVKACAAGLSCTTYYGIAGPSGPAFHSCEVPCGQDKAQCPDATTCVTIADGPGMVCRPKER